MDLSISGEFYCISWIVLKRITFSLQTIGIKKYRKLVSIKSFAFWMIFLFGNIGSFQNCLSTQKNPKKIMKNKFHLCTMNSYVRPLVTILSLVSSIYTNIKSFWGLVWNCITFSTCDMRVINPFEYILPFIVLVHITFPNSWHASSILLMIAKGICLKRF